MRRVVRRIPPEIPAFKLGPKRGYAKVAGGASARIGPIELAIELAQLGRSALRREAVKGLLLLECAALQLRRCKSGGRRTR